MSRPSGTVTVTRERLVRHRGGLRLPVRASTPPTVGRTGTRPVPHRRRARPSGALEDAALQLQAGPAPYEVPLPLRHRRRRQRGRAFLDDITVKTASGTDHRRRRGRRPAAGPPTGAGRSRPAPRTVTTQRYYLIENRQYVGYDATLGRGPLPVLRGRHQAQLGGVLQVPARACWCGCVDDGVRRQQHVRSTRAAATALPGRRHGPNRSPTRTARSPSNRREPFDAAFGLDERRPKTCLHKEVPGRQEGQPDRADARGLRRWRRASGIADVRRHRPAPRTASAANPQNSVEGGGRRRQGHGDRRNRTARSPSTWTTRLALTPPDAGAGTRVRRGASLVARPLLTAE